MDLDAVLTAPLADAAARAAEAEAAGFDGLVVPEANHDGFLPIALAATATRRARLGTSIAIAFARTPMTTAYVAHDLQQLSGGRFTLGLGPQIRPHIENRYSMPWSRPAARMREYVVALRAIWASWNDGAPLDFRGDFYTHTLMTPMFSPGRSEYGPPPVHLAAIGPEMVRVAGEVADGFVAHPLTTAAYLDDVVGPLLVAGRAQGERTDAPAVEAWAMVATGRTDEELAGSVELVRAQIGFYASTPAYVPILAHHGDEAIQPELRTLSKRGDWHAMGRLVDDALLHRYAVVGEPDECAGQLLDRYEGRAERVCLTIMSADSLALGRRVLDAIRPSTR